MPAPEALDPGFLHVLNGETDGRRRRTLRTNAALVEATIRLFRAGATSPTANAVAREAAVSARSLFAHFADVPLLYQAAIKRVLDDMLAGDWPEIQTEQTMATARKRGMRPRPTASRRSTK